MNNLDHLERDLFLWVCIYIGLELLGFKFGKRWASGRVSLWEKGYLSYGYGVIASPSIV